MKDKYHITISFKWFDFWIGLFIDKPSKALYICLFPMFPIKIWITEHKTCPECGAAMRKVAYDIAPEGFDLQWDCEACEDRGEESRIPIDWDMDFRGKDWITRRDLEHFGYEVE